MKTLLKLCVVLALFAGSAWVFMSIPETRRMADRITLPKPERYRLAAWSELEQRGLKPGLPVFIRIFKQTSELELWMKSAQGWELFRTIASASGRAGWGRS
jgi:murein L,D-transpeptidase YafK